MSNSKLNLFSRTGSLEIRVRDSGLNIVARGFGSLEKYLQPGIYQIEYRAGDQIQQELVALRDDQLIEKRDIDLPFPTPVPLDGTSTSHEYYQEAVAALSKAPSGDLAFDSALMIFIRNTGEESGVPLPVESVQKWVLFDSESQPVPNFLDGLQVQTQPGWLGLSARLKPGGYAIRSIDGKHAVEQALWLSSGWITGLFISNTERGPALTTASIQMSRLGEGWSRANAESHEMGRAVELAVAGLRESRSVLPPDQLMMLLKGKFSDPILGIVGAHGVLLQSKPDPDLLTEVLDNLESLAPGHPDVNALRHMSARHGVRTATPPQAATWPPMFSASYRGLLTCDADNAPAIAAGSFSETIAPMFLRTGTWTTWRRPEFETVLWSTSPVENLLQSLQTKPLLSNIYDQLSFSLKVDISEETLRRVERYLREALEMSGPGLLPKLVSEKNISQIALATGLPVSLTKRAVDICLEIIAQIPPIASLLDFGTASEVAQASDLPPGSSPKERSNPASASDQSDH